MALFKIWIYQESPSRLKAAQAASGLYPIKVNISADLDRTPEGNRKRKMINTGEACSSEVFKAMYPPLGETVTPKMKKLAATAEVIAMKKRIEAIKDKYYSITKDLTIDNNPNKIYTIKQLMAAATASHATKVPFEYSVTLLEYHFNKYIQDNREFLSKNSITRMNSALTSFQIFDSLPNHFTSTTAIKKANEFRLNKLKGEHKCKLSIYDIDKSFLTKWQKYMRDGSNFKDGKPRTLKTINGYVKNLTSVLKEAINSDIVAYDISMMPIGQNKKKQYQAPSPQKHEAQIPRYLDSEDLQKLKDYKPESEQEELAKDVWLLSYYLGGCNAVDLCNFRKSNIVKEHNQLVFYRRKNSMKQSQTVSRVPLTDEALKLIEKYKPEPFELKAFTNPKDVQKALYGSKQNISGASGDILYLMNFHQNSANVENTSDNLRRNLNKRYLKDIALKTNMKQSLNFQMARHTCFSNLLKEGATFAEIMEISGHSRTDTLRNYLNALRPKDMHKLAEKL